MRTFLLAVYIALSANPHQIINEKDDPYAGWVVAIAKLKLRLFPWHWK